MSNNTSIVDTKDGISWYHEQQGSGPHVILIPSGEGDCASFSKIASILAHSFTVTTFDMPGMSRTTAPPSAMGNITSDLLADQIIGLMDELDIDIGTFWGCSSGALAALCLAANYPNRVRNIVIHEAPLEQMPGLERLRDGEAEAVAAECKHLFAQIFNEDKAAWESLGPEYHARLEKNYVTWARTYISKVARDFSKDELARRPIEWTIGSMMPAGMFFCNVVVAVQAGVPIGLLPCKHFPQVSIPNILAEHIQKAAQKYL
jgi:pimeloyl-ACP methyl ester carboxylesterase